MKPFFILLSFVAVAASEGCRNIESKRAKNINIDSVSFIARFDKGREQKDGFDLNGYVLSLSIEQANKFDGKLIKVSGVVFIHEGYGSKYYDKRGMDEQQERSGITKYINSPLIEVVEENNNK